MTLQKIAAVLAVLVCTSVVVPSPSPASEPARWQWVLWFQPASGVSVRDDMASGEIGAHVIVSDIPLIGSIGTTVPIGLEVRFSDPSGVLAGGELLYRRIGIETNIIYLSRAAQARGFVPVCGELLTEVQCQLLRQGSLLTPGIDVPDVLLVEEELANLAITTGVNYHLVVTRKWDFWAGPMVAWSVWDKYDVSDVRVDLRTSLQSMVRGKVDQFDASNYPDVSPQNALTFGMNAGVRYHLSNHWGLQGQFRYFGGGEADLPGGTGSYAVAGLSAGIVFRLGG